MTNWLFLSERPFQIIGGLWFFFVGTVLGPFFCGWMVRTVAAINEQIYGELAPWQLTGFAVGRVFFATICCVCAVQGALWLSTAAAASAGLIKAPWS